KPSSNNIATVVSRAELAAEPSSSADQSNSELKLDCAFIDAETETELEPGSEPADVSEAPVSSSTTEETSRALAKDNASSERRRSGSPLAQSASVSSEQSSREIAREPSSVSASQPASDSARLSPESSESSSHLADPDTDLTGLPQLQPRAT
ncbi:unnamed protein product, partial [Ixodes hexagonus]